MTRTTVGGGSDSWPTPNLAEIPPGAFDEPIAYGLEALRQFPKLDGVTFDNVPHDKVVFFDQVESEDEGAIYDDKHRMWIVPVPLDANDWLFGSLVVTRDGAFLRWWSQYDAEELSVDVSCELFKRTKEEA